MDNIVTNSPQVNPPLSLRRQQLGWLVKKHRSLLALLTETIQARQYIPYVEIESLLAAYQELLSVALLPEVSLSKVYQEDQGPLLLCQLGAIHEHGLRLAEYLQQAAVSRFYHPRAFNSGAAELLLSQIPAGL